MKPILPGARGPAVEDIQRRLLVLGYEIGRTGVDGVFLGKTTEAVRAFQAGHGLEEDGVVGDRTWAALVDETFTLGDRMLYLRLPHFHGRDVARLQRALNTLGFSCGTEDAIYGACTEAAVREFQRNSGQPADGIVGPETVSAVEGLRHVWDGEDESTPTPAGTSRPRSIEPLLGTDVVVSAADETASDIAQRFVNLARASDDRARVRVAGATDRRAEEGGDGDVVRGLELVLGCDPDAAASGTPVVHMGDDPTPAFSARLVTALVSMPAGCSRVCIEFGVLGEDERERQRAAARLLEALCGALA